MAEKAIPFFLDISDISPYYRRQTIYNCKIISHGENSETSKN